ncbi:carboxynorspermidine decarboxylase [Helicobacter sp. MIT 14-3879]|uniref:carboxynorspermidine decarboxylase n=1 Tax=Helicobacter sp. MIT 14-3879 TaxID=2040649 RepID=UPI0015F12D70|nr:carboxynorspermidine decarboxylase [Helicobacter sp. MIT 14-3879]
MDDVPINSKDICVFSPAYQESQMQEILQYATHIIFNSFAQWHRFKAMIDSKNKELMVSQQEQIRKIQVGLRINPLYSEVEPPIYNPCIPKSRLGIIPSEFYKGIDTYSALYGYKSHEEFFTAEFCGLHFHTHCEQDSAALSRTLPHVVKHFDSYIALSKWINFGGGHHITREDYNCDLLISLIQDFKAKYKGIEVFLEPGEAVGWQCGDLIGTVIDIIQNEGNVAILDISASCHAPDCLEMPYRPECYKISLQDSTLQNGAKSSRDSCLVDTQNIENSHVSKHETNNSMRSHVLLDSSDKNCIQRLSIESDLGENKGKYRYRFGGPTCLAGDIIGDYSFNTELRIGDRIAFCDMIHYTIVKNTTFNGVELPKLGVIKNDTFTLLKEFDYLDFKNRN